jgi:hypothetical protein
MDQWKPNSVCIQLTKAGIPMPNYSNVDPELLQLLGFSTNTPVTDADVEQARLQMCAELGLDTTLPDDVTVKLARQKGYTPKPKADSSAAGNKKAQATADELAQIPRSTKTGLQSVKALKTSGSTDTRSLASRHPGKGVDVSADTEGDKTIDANATSTNRDQATSLRLRGLTKDGNLDKPKENLLSKIQNFFKRSDS